MARLNIEDALFKDNRFADLIVKLGSKRAALGALAEAWIVAQQLWLPARLGIPATVWKRQRLADEIIEVDLAEVRGDHIYMRGSLEQFAWLERNSEAGKRGGPAAAKSRLENKGETDRPKSSTDVLPRPLTLSLSPSLSLTQTLSQESKTSRRAKKSTTEDEDSAAKVRRDTWDAYRDAYACRYETDPVRNAAVNSKIKQLVERLGEDAPLVAAFFVEHNDRFYVTKGHAIGLCLQDAETLRTQWKTGRKVTGMQAKANEQADFVRDQLARIERGEL